MENINELINIISGLSVPFLVGFFVKRINKLKINNSNKKKIKLLLSIIFSFLISIPIANFTGQTILNVFTFILTSSELSYRFAWSNIIKKEVKNFQF